MNKQKTYHAKLENIKKKWVLVDAKNVVLGRLATKVSRILMGKDKPEYTPSVDTGDFVIIVNADKIKITGKKLTDKKYYRHSGYPGGLKEFSLEDLMKKDSAKIVRMAIRNMLPVNKLRNVRLNHLKIYAGESHKHKAQAPEVIEIS